MYMCKNGKFTYVVLSLVLGAGSLDDFKLESARRGGAGDELNSIEQCTCPDGYGGQYCETCAPGE